MEEIRLDRKSRNVIEVFPYELKKVFLNSQTQPKLLTPSETNTSSDRTSRGCAGMDVWYILVLAGLKLTPNCN